MQLATGCVHHWLVYRTVRRPAWTVRYRRCRHCGECSKSIQRGFEDARSWFDRPIRLPDDRDTDSQIAIIELTQWHNSKQENLA